MPIDLKNYNPMYMQDPVDRPSKYVVTATEWSQLWKLITQQTNNTSGAMAALLKKLTDELWSNNSTQFLKTPELAAGAGDTVESQLAWLRNYVATVEASASAARGVANNSYVVAAEARTIANNADTTANSARNTANEAKTESGVAKMAANNAAFDATNAKTTASQASARASTAETLANEAKTTANTAKATAEGIAGTANAAKTTAEIAKAAADSVVQSKTETDYMLDFFKLQLADNVRERQSIAELRNFNMRSPAPFETFQNLNEWTVTGAGQAIICDWGGMHNGRSIELSVSNLSDGEPRSVTVTKIYDSPQTLESFNAFSFKVYVEWVPHQLDIKLALYGSPEDSVGLFVEGLLTEPAQQGWNTIKIAPGSWTNNEMAQYPFVFRKVSITLSATAGPNAQAKIRLGEMDAKSHQRSHLIPVFVGGDESVYTIAYPHMRDMGYSPGTVYVSSSTVGTPGKLTLTQLEELYAAGWDIANYTETGRALDTLSYDAQKIEIENCAEWLIKRGFIRAPYHVGYPGGKYNADTLRAMYDTGAFTGFVEPDSMIVNNLIYVPVHDYRLLHGRFIRNTTPTSLIDLISKAGTLEGGIILAFPKLVEGNTPPDPKLELFKADSFRQLLTHADNELQQMHTIHGWYTKLRTGIW